MKSKPLPKIISFTDLVAWKVSRKLVSTVYGMVQDFPFTSLIESTRKLGKDL